MRKGLVILMSKKHHVVRFRHKKQVIGGAIRDKQMQIHNIIKSKQEQHKKLVNPSERRFLKLKL